MPLLLALLVIVAGGACVHTQQVHDLVSWGDAHEVVVVQDARVFPATGADVVLEHTDVIVRGARIEAVQPTGQPLPEGALVVDGRGKTLLPGLVDAHVHTHVTGNAPWYVVLPAPEHVLQEALFAGTTTIFDMGGPLDDVTALRDRVASGAVIGPTMFVAGPLLTAEGGYPRSYIERVLPLLGPLFLPRFTRTLGSEAEARATVDELVDAGVDHVKVCLAHTPDSAPVLDAQTLRALTDQAHKRKKKVMAHIDTAENARLAVDNGVDVLVHGVHSTPLSEQDAADIATKGAAVAPTLITFERLAELRERAERTGKDRLVQLSPLEEKSVAVNLQRSLAVPEDYRLNDELQAWLEHLREHADDRLVGNVARMRAAGVRVLVGTDGHGSTAVFPAAIHTEMRMLVHAGIPAGEVLLGATSWPAHTLAGDDADFGTIEPGKRADLLLVAGDPLVDIGATERIDTLVLRGRIVRRRP